MDSLNWPLYRSSGDLLVPGAIFSHRRPWASLDSCSSSDPSSYLEAKISFVATFFFTQQWTLPPAL